jgi:predicted nucleotidyltransferase
MVFVPLTLKYLFSSRLRVEILCHFFFHPGEQIHVRGLASQLHGSVGTTGRELARLQRAGILSSRLVGNQKHYGLSRDCPILDNLSNIFLKTAGVSAELRRALEKSEGAELTFIFGSYASREAHSSSDIDLMVIGSVSDRQLAPLVARLERRLKREINYFLYTRDEVERRLGESDDFIHEILSGPKIFLMGSPHDRLFRTSP